MDKLIKDTYDDSKDFHRFLAPAKINLFLKILTKRKDNYHNLQSVFQLINLYDEIYLKVRSDNKISVEYNNSIRIPKQDDLCLKAAKLILKNFNIGVDIKILKNIPIGAGLGGGSSNAATIFIGLNKLFNLQISKKKLMDIGLSLGADIPFFLNGLNAWVEGVGEKITPISLKNNNYLLIIPNISIPTKNIFKDFKLTNNPIPLKMTTSFEDVKYHKNDNDLHDIILKNYPYLGELISWLERYGNPRITGTGSSIFLKYDNEKLVEQIRKQKPKDIKILRVRGLSVHPHLLTD